jgi:hypothetical protein
MGADDYSINTLPVLKGDLSLPVNIVVGVTGSYTVKLDDLSNVPTSSCVILEDVVTGTKTDLLSTPSYTFTINKNTTAPRFLLHVTDPKGTSPLCAATVGINQHAADIANQINAVSENNKIELFFNLTESANALISIYNYAGQQLVNDYKQSVYKDNVSFDFSDKAQGVYFVKIQIGEHVITKKVVR